MRYLTRHWRRIGLSLLPLVLVFAHTLGWMPIGALERIDAMVYDARMRATMPKTFDDRIVIVDIDEKSLAEQGRWPWSRHKMAALTNRLFDHYQIKLLGFDVVFAEPDDSSGLKQLKALAQQGLQQDTGFITRLAQLTPELDYDGLFAQSLSQRPVVLGYYFTADQQGRTNGVLPAPVMPHTPMSGMTTWSGYGANIAPIAQGASAAGFFNAITEGDGIVRSLPLLASHQGQTYESLSLAMFRLMLGQPRVSAQVAPAAPGGVAGDTLHSVVLAWPGKTFTIPVNAQGAVRLAFKGHGGVTGGSFGYVSATDVMAGRTPLSQLQDKLVLVGTTATGVADLRATPVDATYPGVEAQATALANLLDRQFLVKPADAEGYESLLVLLIGLTLAFALPGLRAPVAIALSTGVMVTLVGFNWWLYTAHQLVLSLAPVLAMTIAISVLHLGHGYLVASRSRRELVGLFGTYVPPELVREMIKDPERYNMRAKNDELTVMFCDLRGFTQMSEQMDPIELQQLLNQIFSELTTLIGANRGTIDKYMGDCVMAFWGAPVESPTHAHLAVKTAMQMIQALDRINQTHRNSTMGHVNLDIGFGIGLNTGKMCVGDMGSNIRRSYTVIGDAVNLGSRLEGLTKTYGVHIVVSQATSRLVNDVIWQELDLVRVKGKQQAIAVLTPVAMVGQLNDQALEELALWHHFLASYRTQDRSQCGLQMAQLLELDPHKPLYQLYAQRLRERCAQPIDPDWDGATNFETKSP